MSRFVAALVDVEWDDEEIAKDWCRGAGGSDRCAGSVSPEGPHIPGQGKLVRVDRLGRRKLDLRNSDFWTDEEHDTFKATGKAPDFTASGGTAPQLGYQPPRPKRRDNGELFPTPKPPPPRATGPRTAVQALADIDAWVTTNPPPHTHQQMEALHDASRKSWRRFNELGGTELSPAHPELVKEAWDAHAVNMERHKAAVAAMAVHKDRFLREALWERDGADLKVTSRHPEVVAGTQFVAKFFGAASEIHGKSVDVAINNTRRAKFAPSRAAGGSIRIGRQAHQTDGATVVHEMGHWVEWNVPAVAAAGVRYRESRTAGEQPRHLGFGFGRNEVTKPDRFLDRYMGKVYPGDRFSEIVSMGLERMYKDPFAFRHQDREMFEFVVGLKDVARR